MIELTTEQKRQVYEEEKARLESETSGIAELLLMANVLLIVGLIGLIGIAKAKFQPRLDDLRKAYSGLDVKEY